MMIKKLLAGAAAAALTITAITVNAFAADNLLGGDVNLGTGWGGEFIDAGKFADVSEGDVVTVEFVINNEDSYHLVKLSSGADGWPKLECSTKAVNNQEDEKFRNQDDGFAVVSVEGSVSYTLTVTDASAIKSSGMVLMGYDITVKSVTVGAPVPAETEAPETTAAEAVTEASADETPVTTTNANTAGNVAVSATKDKSNADTGVEGVAVLAGAAVLAALGVIISKKRK